MSEILNFTAVELGRKIKQGDISVSEAVSASLEQIKSSDINSYITVTEERALQQAESVQAKITSGELNSPIAGVPMAIKDNICTMNVKTSCASKFWVTLILHMMQQQQPELRRQAL